jgi:hypothetical protein
VYILIAGQPRTPPSQLRLTMSTPPVEEQVSRVSIKEMSIADCDAWTTVTLGRLARSHGTASGA